MGLFTPRFDKPGPGIEKDAPPKKGLALFVEIFMREFWELVKLNLLFLVTCLPIVTIGAAMAGMTKVTVMMVRDIPNDVWYDYWRGFKENWKAGTVCGALMLVLFGGGLTGFLLYRRSLPLLVVTAAALILLSMMWVYVFPLITSTNVPLGRALQNSLLLGLMLFYHSLPAAAICAAILFFDIGFFPISLPVALFIGFSVPNFVASFAAWAGIRKHVLREPSEP